MPKQDIMLLSINGATVTQALHDAIEFCKDNNTGLCTLFYGQYQFDIDKDTSIKEKVKDYNFWINSK